MSVHPDELAAARERRQAAEKPTEMPKEFVERRKAFRRESQIIMEQCPTIVKLLRDASSSTKNLGFMQIYPAPTGSEALWVKSGYAAFVAWLERASEDEG